LDLGAWKVLVHARLRRLACPEHGVVTEGCRSRVWGHGSSPTSPTSSRGWRRGWTRPLLTWLCRIDWRTVRAIVARVVADELDPGRLDGLYDIGIDEIAYRKGHRYLSVVTDHAKGKVIWTGEGRDAAAAGRFFDELGPERAHKLAAVSMDMSLAYAKAVEEHAPQATICLDPYHVVALANKALDEVRRAHWNHLRAHEGNDAARKFKGARWALRKRPENLSECQAETLRELERAGGRVWRAYQLKEALRAVFASDLAHEEVAELLDRFGSRAQRSRIPEFVTLGRTIREHRHGILEAIRLGISNARAEAPGAKIKLIVRRARGFHSVPALQAMIMLCCGPIELILPHEK
jgi:transposase